MKIKKTMLAAALAATTMCAASAAFAGPPVTVTFKNLGTQGATYKIETKSTPLPRAADANGKRPAGTTVARWSRT